MLFMEGPYDPDNSIRQITPISIPVTPSSLSYQKLNSQPSLITEFRKGIRRNKSHYEVLKNENYWDDWKRKRISTAHAHGCQDVFNPNYRPLNQDEQLLFEEKNNFIYDVLNSKLLASQGKFYV